MFDEKTSNFHAVLAQSFVNGEVSEKLHDIILGLYESYLVSLDNSGLHKCDIDALFNTLLGLIVLQLKSPFHFQPYHQKIEAPTNYFQFGLEFIRPLFDKPSSLIVGRKNLDLIEKQLNMGENAVLFANHQTEVDPQLMNLLLEESYPRLGSEVVFVAGDRVLTDPLAVPLSMGRNLLCIYSKRHIDTPPEKKEEKLLHNRRTMERMKALLSEGGKFIYVAPSGGRDRADAKGHVAVSAFDPQSIEMFRLMAKQSTKMVHFYPLSLITYDILPPPQQIESELGEKRKAKRGGIRFAFGEPIDMDCFPGNDATDRHLKRQMRATHIWNLVNTNYESLKKL